MRSISSRLITYAVAAMLFIVAFAGAALAAGAAEPQGGSLLDLGRPVLDYILSGHYVAASAAALVIAVAAARRYVAPHWSFLGSTIGSTILTFVGAFGAALAVAASAGAVTLHGAWTAVKVAVGAAGGYTILKNLLAPLEAVSPAWLRPVFRAITWIFDEVDGSGRDAAATAAGDAAVAASPAPGVKSVVGEITELK